MANDSPSQSYGGATGRFWRNVFLIALAHVVLIAGLIRWSLAARASSDPETIMWLGEAGDIAAGQPENEPSPAATPATPQVEQKPAKDDEAEEEKPVVTTSKSEIELPSPTPKATPRATPTPKPTATPRPKPKRTPRPIPRPTPKRALVAKTSPKASQKRKPDSKKTSKKAEETDKKALAKIESASQNAGEKTGSTGKKGSAGGGSKASEFAWYGNMLHDRFYRAWIQPTNITAGTKISTLVKVRIEKDGRVSKFEIVKPSGNVVVNESVRVVAKQVTQVDAPPTGLIKGDHYDVRINFELNTDEKTSD
jgi:periplasmic protein TonB